jgi:hypothetical protein
MTNKTYTSVIDTEVYDNGMDYLDVNVYVTCPDGSEWRRTVSLNKRIGRLDGSVTCYAEKRGCFEEAAEDPPDLVEAMFDERFDEAATLLKEAYRQQISVKDHADEMLQALKNAIEIIEGTGLDASVQRAIVARATGERK